MQHLLFATFLLFSPPTGDVLERMKSDLRSGKVDEAIAAGEAAAKAEPRRAVIQEWLGMAYGQRAQRASLFTALSWAKKCRTAFERAVELEPSNTEAGLSLLEFYVFAPGIAGGSNTKAKALAAKIGSEDSSARHLAQGIVLQHEDKKADAEAAFRKAVERDPADNRAFSGLVNFCASEKRFAEGVELCVRRLALRPDDSFPNYQIGRLVLQWDQEFDKGLASLDRYLQKAPDPDGPTWADARFRKGQILQRMGRIEEARAEYKTALQLNPSHVRAARELKKL